MYQVHYEEEIQQKLIKSASICAKIEAKQEMLTVLVVSCQCCYFCILIIITLFDATVIIQELEGSFLKDLHLIPSIIKKIPGTFAGTRSLDS